MTMVVSAKNGSIVAVTGSGIRHMSDSLIAFQPAIEEPSNIVPSAKMSSSIMVISKVTCCHLPRGSVKRRSTYLTSLSLIDLRTSLAVFMNPPFMTWPGPGGQPIIRIKVNTIGGWSRQYRSKRDMPLEAASTPPAVSLPGQIFAFADEGQLDRVEPGFAGPDPDGLLDIGYKN